MFERKFIENFLTGYSESEKVQIEKDLGIIQAITFNTVKPDTSGAPVYLATAGGPGSAKTTALETYLIDNKLQNYLYADPDQVSLKNMCFTYRSSLTNYHFARAKSNHQALQDAYVKWRGASNYVCHEMLQIAFGGNEGLGPRYSVAHGTTSTSPEIEKLYQRIKALGYRVVLLLCYSHDETRKKTIIRREQEQAFVQTDPNDVISKGINFPKRFDVYFNYADEIHFYWNDELVHEKLPTSCAKLVITASASNLTVSNEADWLNFCKKYLRDIQENDVKICRKFEQIIPRNLLEREKIASASALQAHSMYSAESSASSANAGYDDVTASATTSERMTK